MAKITITIPSGNRPEKLEETVKKWLEKKYNVLVYAWDKDSYEMMGWLGVNRIMGERKPFAVLQNLMIKSLADWDAVICGADDLWPGNRVGALHKAIPLIQGKMAWVYDGLNHYIATHPVITREWYEKYHTVFDETFKHNCCDTDLMMRCFKTRELVKISGVTFDHRNPIHLPIEEKDAIYQIGFSTYDEDRAYFVSKHGRPNMNTVVSRIPRVAV